MHDCTQVAVEVGGSVEVTVLFKPSSVGSGEHVAHISFTSQQVRMYLYNDSCI